MRPVEDLQDDPVGVVDLVERLTDRAHVHHDVAAPLRQVDEVPAQPLDVAVEVETHDRQVPGHGRRARVAAVGVGGGDEVEGRGQVQPGGRRHPTVGERPVHVALVAEVAVVHAEERGVGWGHGAVVLVALHHAVGDPRRRRGVGCHIRAVHLEACPPQVRGEFALPGSDLPVRRFEGGHAGARATASTIAGSEAVTSPALRTPLRLPAGWTARCRREERGGRALQGPSLQRLDHQGIPRAPRYRTRSTRRRRRSSSSRSRGGPRSPGLRPDA